MHSDKRAALNTRRGGIAETKGRKRPCDLPNAKRSLRTAAASRGQSTLPSYGPGPTARLAWMEERPLRVGFPRWLSASPSAASRMSFTGRSCSGASTKTLRMSTSSANLMRNSVGVVERPFDSHLRSVCNQSRLHRASWHTVVGKHCPTIRVDSSRTQFLLEAICALVQLRLWPESEVLC